MFIIEQVAISVSLGRSVTILDIYDCATPPGRISGIWFPSNFYRCWNSYTIKGLVIMTIVLTWGGMALVIGLDGFPISPEQLEATGPLVYIAMLVGSSVAGIALTYLLDGGKGLRELLSRLIKWRVNMRWYAIALLTAPLVAMAILLGLSLSSSEFSPAILSADNKISLILSWFVGGLMIAFFEELGWTGFAIPRMRQHYGVITTAIVVGLLWGLWHFLPFWESDSFTAMLPFSLLLARLFACLPPYRVLMVWVYDHTESLLLVILMHASLVATLQVIVPIELVGGHLLIWLIVWAVALWVLVAGVAAQQQTVQSENVVSKKCIKCLKLR